MAEMKHRFEKLDENGKIKYAPQRDNTGEYTGGKIVMNFPAWLNEDEERRKSLGWIKHLFYENRDDIIASLTEEYNPATDYIVRSVQPVDEYTVKDVYRVIHKTEKMMELEEILSLMDGFYSSYDSNIVFMM